MSQQKAEEEVMTQIKCAFGQMDQDGSGKVNSMELRAYCKQIPGMEGIAECLCEIDTSDDGQISLDELSDFILNKCKKEDIKECHLRRLFKQVDTSNDERINKAEFSALLTQFSFTDEEIDAMMKDIGGDDGMITLSEFITAFKNSC